MALGLRAPARPLLPRCLECARPAGRRSPAVARSDDLDRDARRRLARLRHPQPPRLRATRPLAGALRARSARGLGVGRALRAARCLAAGRLDDRDGDGGERVLRHHPRALGADPREGGGPRARPAARDPGEAALGAQQLPDAARAPHDARRALPVRVRRRPRLARARRADAARRLGTPLLQPPPPGADALVDAGRRRRGVRGAGRARRAERRADDAVHIRERRARARPSSPRPAAAPATPLPTPARRGQSARTSTPRHRPPSSWPTACATVRVRCPPSRAS